MRAVYLAVLFSCALAAGFAVEGGLGLEGEEGEIPFPSSIVQARDGANYVYSISGIYPGKLDPGDLSTSFLSYLKEIGFTDALKAEFDLKGRFLRIVAKKPIPGPILREVINFEARIWGVLPYWTELQWRDRPKAQDYSKRNFKLSFGGVQDAEIHKSGAPIVTQKKRHGRNGSSAS